MGCTFEVVAIGDEDSPGLAVPASGDFPYDYDYTCEWDASLIYLEIRQSMEPEQCDLCDSVLGPLFLFKNLLNPDNYGPSGISVGDGTIAGERAPQQCKTKSFINIS